MGIKTTNSIPKAESPAPIEYRVQTAQNYDFTYWMGEDNRLPSATIPDQSMTIDEILDRYAVGLPFEVGKVPVYQDEEDEENDLMPDLRTMDLAEIQELKEQVNEQINSFRKIQADEDEKRRKQKHEEYLESEVSKRLAALGGKTGSKSPDGGKEPHTNS